MSKHLQARRLAFSLHNVAWKRQEITERLKKLLPLNDTNLEAIAKRLYFQFDESRPPGLKALTAFLFEEPLLDALFTTHIFRQVSLEPPVMRIRQDTLSLLQLPDLPTLADICRWLNLTPEEIFWLSDSRHRQGKVTREQLHHYHYEWVTKRTGGFRLIEKPKPRLKNIQRKIVQEILSRIPPHDCAHGFTKGLSIKTFVTPHIGQQVVLRLDLKNFFHSVPLNRVTAIFKKLGYPPDAARVLKGLCTNAVAPALAGNIFKNLSWEEKKQLQNKHLPQGAPTSAPLANLCAWGLDCRLKGLADHYGYQYTRYADDLTFSGPCSLAARSRFMETLIGAIAADEGFQINHRKTRLKLASQRQRIAGVVVNEKINYCRKDWDQLKAMLHNCIKYGAESQNRDKHTDFKAHLAGRIAHITWLNPLRGTKLQILFDKIIWQNAA